MEISQSNPRWNSTTKICVVPYFLARLTTTRASCDRVITFWYIDPFGATTPPYGVSYTLPSSHCSLITCNGRSDGSKCRFKFCKFQDSLVVNGSIGKTRGTCLVCKLKLYKYAGGFWVTLKWLFHSCIRI